MPCRIVCTMQAPMSTDWADRIVSTPSLGGRPAQHDLCLILGGVDTGKTTLAAALAGRLTPNGPVGIIDADIGQSHIGPPATVGWALVDKSIEDLTQLTPGGISFVGDITPVGHLLQLTAAITQCVRQVSNVTERIVIDTPGFIAGPAATALWWSVQRIVQPKLIVAVQRENELSDILAGVQNLGSQLELLKASPQIPAKSPQARRSYRQNQFRRYFQDSRLHKFKLSGVTVQATRNSGGESLISRLVALRDQEGIDRAVGIIDHGQGDGDIASVRAPQLDISQICCIVVGDVTVDLAGQ